MNISIWGLGAEWDVEGVEGVTPPVRTLLSRFSNSIGSSRLDVELMTLNLELKFEFSFYFFIKYNVENLSELLTLVKYRDLEESELWQKLKKEHSFILRFMITRKHPVRMHISFRRLLPQQVGGSLSLEYGRDRQWVVSASKVFPFPFILRSHTFFQIIYNKINRNSI